MSSSKGFKQSLKLKGERKRVKFYEVKKKWKDKSDRKKYQRDREKKAGRVNEVGKCTHETKKDRTTLPYS